MKRLRPLPEVDKWLASDFVVNSLIPIVGVHPFPLDEQMLMVSTLIWLKPDYIFEWGTYFGKSARIFAETVSHYHLSSQIHSIDLPDDIPHREHPGLNRGKFVKGFKSVCLHQGDGLTTSLKLLKTISASAKILFFLDGDHSYQSVHSELIALHLKRPQAAILVHDTFYQTPSSGYNVGPYRAIETVKRYYQVISTTFGLPGLTLLLPK